MFAGDLGRLRSMRYASRWDGDMASSTAPRTRGRPSTAVSPGTEAAVLGRVATELKKSSHQILVIGHSDNKPIRPTLSKQYPSNWELAGARAASVVRLFAHVGLPSKRLLAVSVADSQPVASNKTEEGRAKNRRIEIRLRPVTAEG